jgi:hypothetical protein
MGTMTMFRGGCYGSPTDLETCGDGDCNVSGLVFVLPLNKTFDDSFTLEET